MRVAIEQDGGLGDVGFTPKKNSDPSYGFDGQKVCKVLKFTHFFVPSVATMLFLGEVNTNVLKCRRKARQV